MFKYKRADRVAELLKEEISTLLLLKINDPDLGFLTITKVKMSDDLRYAKIYFSVLGDSAAITRTQEALARLHHHLRSEIGHRLNLRYVPELNFFYDDSLAYAAHIEEILHQIRKESPEKEE